MCWLKAVARLAPEGRAPAHFLSRPHPVSLCALSGERLCHQLSACQPLVLLFQSADQLTFLLSLLHPPRPPQRSRKEEGKKSGIEILLASLYLVDLPSILPTFSPLLQLCLQNAAKMVCCFQLVLVFFFSQLKKKVKQCNLARQMESHGVIW